MSKTAMTGLKLAKLPDRTPVKITITISPELNKALQAYAELYRQTYGEAEPVAELIPYMLDSFLDSDRGYARALKGQRVDTSASDLRVPVHHHQRRADSTGSSPTAS